MQKNDPLWSAKSQALFKVAVLEADKVAQKSQICKNQPFLCKVEVFSRVFMIVLCKVVNNYSVNSGKFALYFSAKVVASSV